MPFTVAPATLKIALVALGSETLRWMSS